jgi:ABC-type multidrug transport system ATPase subunit
LLRKLGGLDELNKTEEVLYESIEFNEHERCIGYFFKRGLLLSNLTLKENIVLPYQYLNPEECWSGYESAMAWWIDFFRIETDLASRPANAGHAIQKLIAYIRNLVFNPEICIMDDPYFQLSYVFRKKIVDCLRFLKEHHKLLVIGTSDLDLMELFAEDVLVLEKGEIIGRYDFSDNMREVSLKAIRDYLDD